MFDTSQLPFVRNIQKSERQEYEAQLNDFNNCKETLSIKDSYSNPVKIINGLFCLSDYKTENVVYIFKVVNIISKERNILELKPLIRINWKQWLEFGGHKKVTRPGKMKKGPIFIQEIIKILPKKKIIVKKLIVKKCKEPEVNMKEIVANLENKIKALEEKSEKFIYELSEMNLSYQKDLKDKTDIQKSHYETMKLKVISILTEF